MVERADFRVVDLFASLDWTAFLSLQGAVASAVTEGEQELWVNLSTAVGDPAAILEMCTLLRQNGLPVRVHNVGLVGEVPMLFYLSADIRTAAPDANFEVVVCSMDEMHSHLSLHSVGFSAEAVENLVARQRMQALLSDRYGLWMDGYGVRRLLISAEEAEHLGIAQVCDTHLLRGNQDTAGPHRAGRPNYLARS